MNTKFNGKFATLVNKDGVQSTFSGHGAGAESGYMVLDNVAIGAVTMRKINAAVAQAGCATEQDALRVAREFIRADERCNRIIARAAGDEE